MSTPSTLNDSDDVNSLSVDILSVAMRMHGCQSFADYTQGMRCEETPADFVDSLGVSSMSPRERRRAPASVLLSLDVAASACEGAGIAASSMVGVFASGVGDADTMNQLYMTVGSDDKQVSPTVFHNSVHNAASGYWTIGNQCQNAVSFISAEQYTFSMALLEALILANTQPRPVLLVISDIVSPQALVHLHGLSGSFAMALVLTGSHSDRNVDAAQSLSTCASKKMRARVLDSASPWPKYTARAEFESQNELYESNPAARGLGLLHLLADNSGSVDLCVPLSEYSSLQLS